MFTKQFVVLLVCLVNFECVYNAKIAQTNKDIGQRQQKMETFFNHQKDNSNDYRSTFVIYLISRFFLRIRKRQEKELALLDKVIGSSSEEDKKKKYEEEGKKRREEEERKKREVEMMERIKRKKKGPTSLQMDSSSTLEEKEDNTAIEMKDEEMEKRKFLKEWEIRAKESLEKSVKINEDDSMKTMRDEESQMSLVGSVFSDSSLASTTQSFSSTIKGKEETKEEITNQSITVDERSYSSRTESNSSDAFSKK
uniref:Uncharacterized protein n=1 Tax=Meloidogyne hapla TaxID=6305 RepID=A0A1I8AYI5_MELHA